VRIALHEDPLLILSSRRTRLVACVKPSPTATAKSLVHIETKLGEGPIGDGLDHSGKAGFGGCVELAFAGACVLMAVVVRLPRLRPVEDNHANISNATQMVEAASQDMGIDWFGDPIGVEATR
jgi:hypothetical protein